MTLPTTSLSSDSLPSHQDIRQTNGTDTFDVIGIGFGPSNIAFAAALADENEAHPDKAQLTALFLESSPATVWHPGMLLPDAVMQIAFPKDLATLRNPRSRFTFFNYLFENNRLTDFINLQTFFPSRQEIADYIQWAARNVPVDVQYGTSVTSIDTDGDIAVVNTVDADGNTQHYRARAVLLGTGLNPSLPDGLTENDRVSHSVHILPFLEQFREHNTTTPNKKLAVLGGGQSAAEIAKYLHATFPDSEVHLIHTRYGLTPSDDSPFANRVFDPDAVDKWHAAPVEERERLRAVHAGTNYTAVDPDLLNELFRLTYKERLDGKKRLFIHDTTYVTSITETPDGVQLQLENSMDSTTETLNADMLICGTGFHESDPREFFVDLSHIPVDENGRVIVERDYRLATGDTPAPAIYLCGGVEHSHGFSSSLLSLVSIRAGDVLESVKSYLATTSTRVT